MEKYKLAVLVSHPIHHQVSFFREMARHPMIDATVYFCFDFGLKERFDAYIGRNVKWDIPLLDGYQHQFLKNISPRPSFRFFGQINPGIISELFQKKYDAVLMYGYAFATNWLLILGAWLSRTPLILGGEMILRPDRPWWKKTLKWLVIKFLFWRAAAFLSFGRLGDRFYECYRTSKASIFKTPYAVDNARFSEAFGKLRTERDNLREEMSIKKEDPVVLFVGKLVSWKAPLDLLRAYQQAVSVGTISVSPHLLFVGDGQLRNELESYAKDQGISNVHFVGFKNQSELPLYYAISDLFVMPSKGDTWGLVVNEAMNFALPVIVSDAVGSSLDLVKDGENGYVFRAGDVEDLSGRLSELINDKNKRERFGNKSLAIIRDFSYENDVVGIFEALNFIKNNQRHGKE